MGSTVLGARVVLGGVFAIAGAAKLLDRPGTREALRGFGIHERVVTGGAVLLPIAELATAIALIPRPSAQWGGLAALLLLVGFSAGIANALVRGRSPDCHCFGQLHSAPASRWTLVRNLGLAVPAGLVLLEGPGPSVDGWVAGRTAAEIVAVVSVAAAICVAAVATRMWRDNRALRRHLGELNQELLAFPPGLPVGARAPHFSLPSVQGGTVTLDALLSRGRPVALVFLEPECASCGVLFTELARWQATFATHLTVVAVSTGTRAQNRGQADGAEILVQDGDEVMRAYRVWGTPAAVVVNADGRIASGVASGFYTVEALFRLTLRRQPAAAPTSPAVRSAQPVT
jgi:peroxiredoxin